VTHAEPTDSPLPRADIGVFGGSGFYDFLDEVELVEIDTPWGAPSAPVALGTIEGVRVAFLPRHGAGHGLPPHRVPYRANVAAMVELGVGGLLSPFAAGSLQPGIHPGDFVVVDQFVDRTNGREATFHDIFDQGPQHAALADPYHAGLRACLVDTARRQGITVHDGGTVVVVQGPRFSTRAESAWHRSMGWHVVNMTQSTEASLAGEAGLPFAGVALVTDYDSGVEGGDIAPVTQEEVFAVFEANVHRVRDLLFAAIPAAAAAVGRGA